MPSRTSNRSANHIHAWAATEVSGRLVVLLDQCAKITGETRSRLVRDGIRHVVEETLRGRGVGIHLYALFREMRFYIAKLDVPTIRESLVNKLMAAIDNAHNRAKKAKETEDRLEHYRAMGYPCRDLEPAP